MNAIHSLIFQLSSELTKPPVIYLLTHLINVNVSCFLLWKSCLSRVCGKRLSIEKPSKRLGVQLFVRTTLQCNYFEWRWSKKKFGIGNWKICFIHRVWGFLRSSMFSPARLEHVHYKPSPAIAVCREWLFLFRFAGFMLTGFQIYYYESRDYARCLG